MKEMELYAFLEKRFLASLLDELIPGIFHNFANPLNGILGRSKLMEKRLVDFIEKMETRYPDIEKNAGAGYKKLISDIRAIGNESELFYDLFRISTGKFYALGAREIETINLSALVEAELAFTDFYLDFKHHITKKTDLDTEMPEIRGRVAFYSMAFGILLRQTMKEMRQRNRATFFTSTGHDDHSVSASLTLLNGSLPQGWQEILSSPEARPGATSTAAADPQRDLIVALSLLKIASEGVDLLYDEGKEMLTIRIPYRDKPTAIYGGKA